MNFVLTLSVSALTGLILHKMKVPGGVMIGALLGALAFNVVSGSANMPFEAKFTAQIMAGAFIGCSFSRSDLKKLPSISGALFVIISTFFVLNMVLGFLIYRLTQMDLLTCLMATVPAGMSDTPIIAAELGADAGKVTLLQFVRLVAGIVIFPSMISSYDKRAGCESRHSDGDLACQTPGNDRAGGAAGPVITLAAAFLGGWLGKAVGMPAGALVMSMIFVIVLKLLGGAAYFPGFARRLTQVLSGAYIGSGMGAGDLFELKFLVLPMIIILVGYTVNCFFVGGILHKYFNMERKAAMLAVTPAGARDMALISADIGVVSSELNVIQVLRMILIISFFPQIIVQIVRIAA